MVRYNTNLSKFETFENGNWFQITTSSDARLKKDIEPIQGALAMTERMRPVYFNWDQSNPKAQGYLDKHQVGFIAQELEQVLPEVVIEGTDTYRNVEYGKIVPVAIAAIKELNVQQKKSDRMCLATQERMTREIQSLRDENSQLRLLVESMDKRLKALESK